MPEMRSVSPFPWVGNKTWMVDRIVPLMPPNPTLICEVFCGSAALTFGIPHHSGVQYMINDIDSEIINFFHCLREKPLQLIDAVRDYPVNSQEDFRLLMQALYPKGEADKEPTARIQHFLEVCLRGIDLPGELEKADQMLEKEQAYLAGEEIRQKAEVGDCCRAAHFLRRQVYSFRSGGTTYGPRMTDIRRYEQIIRRCAYIMQGVPILSESYEKCIQRNDSPGAFLFMDPPYHGTEDFYQQEDKDSVFGEKDHVLLRDLALDGQADMMITYNDDAYIRELYKNPRFHIIEAVHHNSMSAKAGKDLCELMILNYDPPVEPNITEQLSLF